MSDPKEQQLHLRMTTRMARQLSRLAERNGVSAQEMVLILIREEVNRIAYEARADA